MTLSGWMLYALTVSLLAAAAAWTLEEGLARTRVPRRWIWALALALSVALPLAALFPQASDPGEKPAVAAIQFSGTEGSREADPRGESLFRGLATWPGNAARAVADGMGAAMNRVAAFLPAGRDVTRWTLALWIWWSAALAAALGISAFLMARQRRGWPRTSIRNRPVRIAPDLGPAVVGVVSPEIVVPAWMLSLKGDDLELVLAHEEEHLRAHDPLLLGASLLPLVAAPWNPAIWWQVKKLKEAVEVDCDRRVLRAGASAGAYGSLLVRIGNREHGSLFPSAALAGSHPLLMRRLQAMRRPGGKGQALVGSAAGVLSLGFFGLALEAHTPVRPPVLETQVVLAAPIATSSVPGVPYTVVTPEANLAHPDTAIEPAVVVESEPAPVVQAAVDTEGVAEATPAEGPAVELAVAEPALEIIPPTPPGVLPQPEVASPVRLEPRVDLPPIRAVVEPHRAQPVIAALVVQTPPEIQNLATVQRALRREYPAPLSSAGFGGTVQLRLKVDERGGVSEMLLAQSSGIPALDAAALRVAQTVQFTPASHAGQAVSTWAHLPITFRPPSE